MAFPTMWIVLPILLLPIVDATWPKVPQIPVSSAFQRSPLDDDYASYYDDPPPKGSLIPSPNDFASLPTCQHACLKPLMEVLGADFNANNLIMTVCTKYSETVVCMDKCATGGNRDLFDVLTSGLKYMCLEQRETFEARMACIDATAVPITSECHRNCNSKDKFTTLIADSGLLEMFLPHDNRDDQDANGRTFPTSDFQFKAMSATMRTSCDLAECFLDCIKTRYNTHCGDNIGNFVTEAIVKPIVKTHESDAFVAFGGIIESMLPETCSFLVAPKKLRSFRVDPDMERQFKPEFVKSEAPFSSVSSRSKETPADATSSTLTSNSPEATPASEVTRKLAITTKTNNHGDLFPTKLHKNESLVLLSVDGRQNSYIKEEASKISMSVMLFIANVLGTSISGLSFFFYVISNFAEITIGVIIVFIVVELVALSVTITACILKSEEFLTSVVVCLSVFFAIGGAFCAYVDARKSPPRKAHFLASIAALCFVFTTCTCAFFEIPVIWIFLSLLGGSFAFFCGIYFLVSMCLSKRLVAAPIAARTAATDARSIAIAVDVHATASEVAATACENASTLSEAGRAAKLAGYQAIKAAEVAKKAAEVANVSGDAAKKAGLKLIKDATSTPGATTTAGANVPTVSIAPTTTTTTATMTTTTTAPTTTTATTSSITSQTTTAITAPTISTTSTVSTDNTGLTEKRVHPTTRAPRGTTVVTQV